MMKGCGFEASNNIAPRFRGLSKETGRRRGGDSSAELAESAYPFEN
jgi:hypothetical protein